MIGSWICSLNRTFIRIWKVLPFSMVLVNIPLSSLIAKSTISACLSPYSKVLGFGRKCSWLMDATVAFARSSPPSVFCFTGSCPTSSCLYRSTISFGEPSSSLTPLLRRITRSQYLDTLLKSWVTKRMVFPCFLNSSNL